MSEPQACQFNDVMKCLLHNSQGIGNICDLGLAALRATVEEQARVIGRLREALSVYGSHRYFCDAKPYDPCNCGLAQVLSPTEPLHKPIPHYVCPCAKCRAASYTTEPTEA